MVSSHNNYGLDSHLVSPLHLHSHYPTTKFTAVGDTPENLRLKEQQKRQSNVSTCGLGQSYKIVDCCRRHVSILTLISTCEWMVSHSADHEMISALAIGTHFIAQPQKLYLKFNTFWRYEWHHECCGYHQYGYLNVLIFCPWSCLIRSSTSPDIVRVFRSLHRLLIIRRAHVSSVRSSTPALAMLSRRQLQVLCCCWQAHVEVACHDILTFERLMTLWPGWDL